MLLRTALGPRPFTALPCLLTIALWLIPAVPATVCHSAPPAALAADPRLPGALEQAKALIENQQHDNAVTLLKQFLAKNPRSAFLDRAYLLMAAALTGREAHGEAASYLEQLLAEFPTSEVGGRARLMLARAKIHLGEPDAALPILAEARSLSPDPQSRRDALQLSGELHAAKQDWLRAVADWLDELDLTPLEQRDEVRDRLRTLIQEKLDRKTLLRLRDRYPTRYPGDLVLIRLIELHAARGEEHQAERQIHLFLSRFPDHDYAQTASELLRSLRARLKSSQYTIGVLVPLTGRLAAYGAEALNGIRLAVDRAREVEGLGSIGVIVKDSETDKSALRADLLETIEEYRPVAVIGPFLSRDLPLAAAISEQTEVPFITPSATSADVRKFGPYLFSTALTYPSQARRLAEYAITRLGYFRFCVLYPETTYGQELARHFSHEVRQRGGEVVASEAYKPSEVDFGTQIRRLKEIDLTGEGTTSTTKTSKGTVRTTYTPGFDAIFLPGDYNQVALIAPQLVFYDIKVPLLGSNGWNSPDLLRLADRTLEGSIFVDAFFLDSPDPLVREFVDRYRKRYQSNPSIFAAQAYDAARLILESLRHGATSGRMVREQLARGPEQAGANGQPLFGPGGILNRQLFLIQVKQNKFVQID